MSFKSEDYKGMVSSVTHVIEIPAIDNEIINVKAVYKEGDETAIIYVDGKEKYIPDNMKVPVKYLVDDAGLGFAIGQK